MAVLFGDGVRGVAADANARSQPQALEGVGPPLRGGDDERVVDVATGQATRLQHQGYVPVPAGDRAGMNLGGGRDPAVCAGIRPDQARTDGKAEKKPAAVDRQVTASRRTMARPGAGGSGYRQRKGNGRQATRGH
jgi:hypothetical protein